MGDGNHYNWRQWYQDRYSEMTGFGLWLRGGEINTFSPQEYDARKFRVQFVRLSTYFDTGYSFTHQFLYQIAASIPGVFPDLSYLPPRADAQIFDRDQVPHKVPWLLGTQTKMGPAAFDLIGFSNSIVQELINIPTFLSKSDIPLRKSMRLERPDLPLLILGGANALYSSALWNDAPLVDGIFIGENEAMIRRLLEICRDGKIAGRSKRETLSALEEIPGFLQPEKAREKLRSRQTIKKNFNSDLNESEALYRGPIYYIEDQLGNSHLQISEGCPCFCSFCAESWDRKPYRERSDQKLREIALQAKAWMGLDQIDIYSFNFNLHSGIYRILWDLIPRFRSIGLKSQRFDLLAHDPQMAEFQHAIEKASFTCGLEGISPRIRNYLHKSLETEDLHKSLGAIFKSKAREVKVFLIATGLEEEQDFVAFGDFLDHLKEIRVACNSTARMIFSMTPLVRFPWTPMEFEDAYPMERYEKIIAKTAGRVRSAGFEFRESADLPEYWTSQVLVRSGDPRVMTALLKTIERTGFVYYRVISDGFLKEFTRSLHEEGVDMESLLKGYSLEDSAARPWDFPWMVMETGVKREFMWEDVQRSRAFMESNYCLNRKWIKGKCFHCGGCPSRFHVRAIVLAEQKREYTLDQLRERIRKARIGEKEIRVLVSTGTLARGVPRKMLGVAVARALMLTDSRLVEGYRGYRGAYWANDEKPVWITGDDEVKLAWDQDSLRVLREVLESRLREVNSHMGEWGEVRGEVNEPWVAGKLIATSPFPHQLDQYLRNYDLRHTLRKIQKDGNVVGHVFELIPQALKKNIVSTLSVENGVVTLTPGSKFDAEEFARDGFKLNRPSDWVRVVLHSTQA